MMQMVISTIPLMIILVPQIMELAHHTHKLVSLVKPTTPFMYGHITVVATSSSLELNEQTSDCPSSFICGTSTVTYDGVTYNTVQIGSQCWLKENLRTTKYNDNSSIPEVTDASTWTSTTSGAYCCYDNNPSNCDTYGALYNWYAVNTGKLCPSGWHVPSDAEWIH